MLVWYFCNTPSNLAIWLSFGYSTVCHCEEAPNLLMKLCKEVCDAKADPLSGRTLLFLFKRHFLTPSGRTFVNGREYVLHAWGSAAGLLCMLERSRDL